MAEQVTIVSGLRGAETRETAAVVSMDDTWLFVETADGVRRRFSRATGFEHAEGGSWSMWRLAGTDFRRLKPR